MTRTASPTGPGISVFDVMAGLHATIGIVAALRYRERTGQGQHVEVSLMSSALSALANHASAALNSAAVPFRMVNAHPSVFPYEPLPTADGELVIAAGNDRQFRLLCAAIGAPELGADPRFARNADRTANREVLRPLLVRQLAAAGGREWFDRLTAAGVPCGPINTVDQGIALAASLGLEPVVELASAAGDGAVPGEGGEGDASATRRSVRHPIRLSATPAGYRLAPPELDEHGDAIRAWLSGAGTPPGTIEEAP